MRHSLLALIALVCGSTGALTAWANEPDDAVPDIVAAAPAPPEAAPVAATPRQRLEQAVRYYQLGRRDEARDSLTELVLDARIDDPELLQEARVYLAELLYTEGDEEGARRFFEQVLREDPSYAINHFKHPPDVCGFFDYVRAYMAPMWPPEPLPLPQMMPRLHWTAWLPVGGIYQLSHGQPGKGAAFLAGEMVCLAGSASLFAVLLDLRYYPEGDNAELQRRTQLKWTQWGFSAGYWAIWGWSRVAASQHWRLKVVPQLGREPPNGEATWARTRQGVMVGLQGPI